MGLKEILILTTIKFPAESSKVNLMCTKVTLFIFPVAILKMIKYIKLRINTFRSLLGYAIKWHVSESVGLAVSSLHPPEGG